MATIRDSIIAAASAVKGESVEAGPTITDALDALTDALAGENVDSAPLIADEFAIMAQYLNSGGGGGELGDMVVVKVSETVEDLTFGIRINDHFVCPNYVDTAGAYFAAGITIVIPHGANASATVTVGDADPVAMHDDTEHGEFTYTIPVDTEANTEIIIDGTGF